MYMTINKKLDDLTISSKSHPQHYMLHKYWGRKPHNLVRDYIELFTKTGDTVLDPFMGSGGAVIESNKLKRIGIGVDLNPMACLIVNETLKKELDFDKLVKEFNNIVNGIPDEVNKLAYTKDKNGQFQLIDNAIWEHGKISRIKYYQDKKRNIKDADEYDQLTVITATKLLAKYEKSGMISFPRDEIMTYVRRSGKHHINELFTDRNLLFAAFFMTGVKKVKNKFPQKALLLMANKADLLSEAEKSDLQQHLSAHENEVTRSLLLSAKSGEGVEELKTTLLNFVNTGALRNNETIVTNTRHYDALL